MRVPKGKKRCGKCERVRSITCFAIRLHRTGLRQAWCRDCRKVYDAARYGKLERERCREKSRALRKRNRDFVFAYLLEHPCADCGETDPVVLEFDHVRGEKEFEVTLRVNNGHSLSKIMGEIAKCDVRCANCHRRRTLIESGAHRTRAVAQSGSAPGLGPGGLAGSNPARPNGKPRGKLPRGFPHVHLLLNSHPDRTDPEVVRAAVVVTPPRRKKK